MEYTFKTKFNKGDIVYTIMNMSYDYGEEPSISRLLVIGCAIDKPVSTKTPDIMYLCVLCDKDGNPTGQLIGYEKTRLFSENVLHLNIEDFIKECNINVEKTKCCDKEEVLENPCDITEITGEDIMTVHFPEINKK